MDSKPKDEPVSLDPEAEVERLKEELRVQKDMYLRVLADCDNYRKRVERDRAKEIRNGRRDLILSVLETLDEFERAFLNAERNPAPLSEGVRLIYRLLQNRITAEGVMPYKSQGEQFNPKYHEAVGTTPGGEYAPGTIAEEVRKGYRWGEEVLRPARVIVAQ